MTETRPLDALEMRDDFASRHIGPTPQDVDAMLEVVGVPTLEDLLDRTVPASIRHDEPLALDPALTEREAVEALRAMADRNRPLVSMIGMGYYGTVTPPVVLRNILENPAWYTAYTPYQAEVSQGRLEALLNFQQVVMDLTGMDLANASLLDEATAAAEAMAMARRLSKSKSATVLRRCRLPSADHRSGADPGRPVGNRAGGGRSVRTRSEDDELGRARCSGCSSSTRGRAARCATRRRSSNGCTPRRGLAVFAADLLADLPRRAAGRLRRGHRGRQRPALRGARWGSAGRTPHSSRPATPTSARRRGGSSAVSVDARGRIALRMALQTREQHIRREKATSNICTAQVLLAVMAGMYAVYHGPERLRAIAERVHRLTRALAGGLAAAGREVVTEAYFDTITVRVPGEAEALVGRARDAGFNVRRTDANHIGLSLDETTRREDVRGVIRALSAGGGEGAEVRDVEALDAAAPDVLGALARTSAYLEHPVFHAHHGETEMLRYLRRLAAKDVALDRAMIPLGSCTMKLNATAEMIPVTFPGFGALHPFVPADQALGYRELCTGLERMLCAITGFDAVSLQPNAGSQGEYAGLLCIRRYHESRGEGARDVCLIPASAHGTNPASAIMAGMRVVVVACDENGNVDLRDLELKAREHRERLGALMVTYPSTHGVFEEGIVDICNVVHEHGGQVYMDGANLNAMVGLSRPARIGADVSHINLHKTFCIPHGGGGPGMGPIGVRSHLAPFLPDHPVVGGVNPAADPSGTVGTVSAAPWGSAGILPISWAYIAMMGRARPATGDRGGDPRMRTTSRRGSAARSRCSTRARPSRCCTRARTGSSRTSASSTCAR